MDQPLMFDQPTSPVESSPARPAKRSRRTPTAKKPPVACSLHALQERAVRYALHMEEDTAGAQTMPEFLAEAVAYQLKRKQRAGLEFPPKMLAELLELQLIK